MLLEFPDHYCSNAILCSACTFTFQQCCTECSFMKGMTCRSWVASCSVWACECRSWARSVFRSWAKKPEVKSLCVQDKQFVELILGDRPPKVARLAYDQFMNNIRSILGGSIPSQELQDVCQAVFIGLDAVSSNAKAKKRTPADHTQPLRCFSLPSDFDLKLSCQKTGFSLQDYSLLSLLSPSLV